MSRLRHLSQVPVLRLLLLVLLSCGLVTSPVLAATCAINDAQQPAATGESANDGIPERGNGDACCPSQACDACCAQAAATAPASKQTLLHCLPANPCSVMSVEFRPTAYPVDLRPPITT